MEKVINSTLSTCIFIEIRNTLEYILYNHMQEIHFIDKWRHFKCLFYKILNGNHWFLPFQFNSSHFLCFFSSFYTATKLFDNIAFQREISTCIRDNLTKIACTLLSTFLCFYMLGLNCAHLIKQWSSFLLHWICAMDITLVFNERA